MVAGARNAECYTVAETDWICPRVGIRSNSREVSGEGAPLAGAMHTVRARLN
jgi:hypothetical protein